MSDYLDKAALTAQSLPEDDLPLARGKVRVRGLSRGEVFAMQEGKRLGVLKDMGAWERRMVSLALVIPEMTEDEVGEWQRTAPAGGDLEKLTNKISELSGLSEGADKSHVQEVSGEPGSGV